MYLWRKNYPRARYQPVVCIHGIFYVVKDEIVVKYRFFEWVVPSALASHITYNPRHLPVIITENKCTTPSSTQWVPSSLYGESASLLPDVSLE